MRKWKVNSYILSVCVLISEYVRQQQQEAKQSCSVTEDSVDSIVDTVAPALVMTRRSLNALARFLTREIQYPTMITYDRFTTLQSLLHRLEINLNNTKDFQQLSWQLVSILTKIESPNAVWNTVEQITECVAPMQSSQEDKERNVDSASSTLFRTSLLGVYVRSFLLAVNRLLFDGLSRLYDDVQQYLEQFQIDVQRQNQLEQEEEKKRSLNLVESPSSQPLRTERHMEDNKLRLSPIKLGNVTPTYNIQLSNQMTPVSSKLEFQASVEKLMVAKAAQEVNDSNVWSNDQLNFILNDMVRELEGIRSNQLRDSQQTKDSLPREHLRLLWKSMDRSNPHVLFVKYLHFLSNRDYQGALDSLHQYHDVLSPRQAVNGSAASDGNSLASRSTIGFQFRGSGIQYAALNLAGLQIIFDHFNAAQESIQEAIRVAQHHGDHICVAFALAWMIRIHQNIGASKGEVLQLVGSCLDRAKELRLPALQVLATLTEVESSLMRYSTTKSDEVRSASQLVSHIFVAHAPSPRPLHIWSRLGAAMQSIASISTPKASVLNNSTRAMNALQAQVEARPDSSNRSSGSGMDWAKSTEAILDTVWNLSGKVTLTIAAGWSVFGQRSLEKVFSHMHLLCYEDSASIGEIAQTVSRMAISKLAQTDKEGVVYVRVLEFLVGLFADEKDIDERRHLLNDKTFQRTLHYFFYLWALGRGEFTRAEVHLNLIVVLSPQEKDIASHLEALILTANLWVSVGDYTQGLKLLENLEVMCRELDLAHLHAQVLIAISRTRFQAAAPHAPFASLNVLLKSVDICRRHHYDLLLAEAHVVMAEIYIAMGKLHDAYLLINDQMPLVFEHGSVNLRGECLLVLAKTMVANIERSDEGTNEPSFAVTKALHTLKASAEMFSLVQNLQRQKEVCYLQSLVYNHMALQAEKCNHDPNSFCKRREEAAAMFLKHSLQLHRAAFLTVEPFFALDTPESICQVIANRSSEL